MKTEWTWRGFNLTPRLDKIRRAFRLEPVSCAEDVPILVNTPAYFSFGSRDKPADYYTNPASMLEYQADGYQRHLQLVQDDYIPYFMPWYGTGVLASAFGAKILVPEDAADDPAVLEPLIHSPQEAARLKLPDPGKDGWMPRVLDSIDFAKANGDLPVGLTDMQGPLDTLGQICGQSQLYQWMYREPAMIHQLMDLVTEAFIQWVMVQKAHIGEPLEWSYGLQGTVSPGCGVWESDDDLVLIDSGLYAEFVVPYISRIFNAFSGGSIHFCGSGIHHVKNFKNVQNLKVINTSALGNYKSFSSLYQKMNNQVVIQLQDASPAEPESYYGRLFSGMDDFRGLMLVTFVMDKVAMDNQGGYIPVEWDSFEAANRIVASVRKTIHMRLNGEATWSEPQTHGPAQAPKPAAEESRAKKEYLPAQAAALEDVRQAMLDFNQSGIIQAVQAALEALIQPNDIILDGMAAALSEIGEYYEKGEYYLPELLMAGVTMQEGMSVLTPILKAKVTEESISKGKVILGTVKGDMHDIGKNLVKTMLEGAQFEVIDLGVDVAPMKFIEALQTNHAKLLAMSALLTTTMVNMKTTMEALQTAGIRDQVKVIIGGAPLSQEYADQIEADGYAATAVGAVGVAERLLGIK
jgi:corrinoid protein of di/trimethylamine methyltransferase